MSNSVDTLTPPAAGTKRPSMLCRCPDGRRARQESGRAGVPPGGVSRSPSRSSLVLDRHPEYRHARILERIIEPERVLMFRVPWVDDQGEVQHQPRLPDRDEQRDRPLQGRPALPPLGQPRHPQVPRLRAGVQERADHAADGRRQGRLRLRSQGQERRRGDALLPVVHDRALTATSARTPTCRPATSASAAGRSATCSASTRSCATSSPACSPARA